jgi:glyoxylase-like metal-dependent hydrolase (beta-lactamase superfamily II)
MKYLGQFAAAAIIAAGVMVGANVHTAAQQQEPETLTPFVPGGVKPAYDDGNVEVVKVQGNVYLVAGSGANIVVQTDPDGPLVVDTSVPEMADKVIAAIKSITDRPIRQIINTSADNQRTAGNEMISKAGSNINAGVGGGVGREPERVQGAPIIAHERAMHRMAGLLDEPKRENVMWPGDTFVGMRKDWYWGGEPIDILYKPAAHSDGDLIVWFRKSDVIATGGILNTVNYPVIDVKRGGTVEGYLSALNDILDIMIPERGNQGGTLAVPGNGRICNEGDVAEIRDSLTIIVDRVRDMVKKNMTLAQVKAAKPTLDYDGVFGDPNAFIESVYTDLSRVAKASAPARATR